jgi:hypothetical protein
MIPDVERFISESNPAVQSLIRSIYHELVDVHRCTAYVKTIYVGFEISGEMVAALYAHPTSIEVALALPEDHPSSLLADATHLTWRSLPVAADIGTPEEFTTLQPLLAEAVERIRTAAHDVNRDPEHFMGRSRRLANPRLIRPKDGRRCE